MYRAANAPAGAPSDGPSADQPGGGRETGARGSDDVIDAEVVEEEKK
jgi:hypothetical protein